jgi:hypothetical protein
MHFCITINGVPANVLLDYDSSDDFVGTQVIRMNRLAIKRHDNVSLAIQQGGA